MNMDITAGLMRIGLGTTRPNGTAQFAFKSSFLENRSYCRGGKKSVRFNPKEVGDSSANSFFRRESVSIDTLITAGDDAMKVCGEDCIFQLIENARL